MVTLDNAPNFSTLSECLKRSQRDLAQQSCVLVVGSQRRKKDSFTKSVITEGLQAPYTPRLPNWPWLALVGDSLSRRLWALGGPKVAQDSSAKLRSSFISY